VGSTWLGLKDRLNRGGESVGFGSEDGAAAALDLVGPLAQSTEEGADRVTDAGFGAEAGVGGHLADLSSQVEVRWLAAEELQTLPRIMC
jgi:hypothetical protein